jgi:hypothetical protein
MLDRGDGALALAYAASSLSAGLVGVWLTTNLVRRARVAG